MRSSSQLDKRSKTCFFTFLDMYVSRIERDKILISQLSLPNLGILQTSMDQKRDPMKVNFDSFQIEK